MQHEVDIGVTGNRVVGVEEAEGVVRTAHQRDAEAVDLPFRQGAGAAQHRQRFPDAETVVIDAAGLETFGEDLHGVVAVGIGRERAGLGYFGKVRRGAQFPGALDGGVGGQTGPQHDAGRIGIAAGDTVPEHRIGSDGLRQDGRRHGQKGRAAGHAGQQGAAGNFGLAECAGHLSVLLVLGPVLVGRDPCHAGIAVFGKNGTRAGFGHRPAPTLPHECLWFSDQKSAVAVKTIVRGAPIHA